MKVLKIILWLLVALIVVVVGVGFFLPNTAHVERSIVINAPACHVYALVNSYRGFNRWSPWAQIDPAGTTYERTGPEWGVGAKQSWSSDNKNVGSGSQEIVSSTACSEVRSKLDFGPQGVADAFFVMAPEGDGTKVTWGFDTAFGMNLIGRYFGLMFDKMIGGDYEKGLAALKSLAESAPPFDISGLDVSMVETEATPIAYLTITTGTESESIGAAMGQAYGQILAQLAAKGAKQAGQPLSINTEIREDGYVFDTAIPIEPFDGEFEGGVMMGTTYAGNALQFVHKGPYHELPNTYQKIAAFMELYAFEASDRSWDEYVSDPGNTDEADLITHIYFPVD
ncbi:MAG: SRPBCC family protein [Acidobacteria bacterium]|nr:SRPBCC family protein [Acidobacteriota bacterium]